MTGEIVDFGDIPGKPCSHEVQGKICNPKSPEFFIPWTTEEAAKERDELEQIMCKMMDRDYEEWKDSQEEREPHIAAEPWKEAEKQKEKLLGLPSFTGASDSETLAPGTEVIRDRKFYEDKLKVKQSKDPIREKIKNNLVDRALNNQTDYV